MYRSSFGWTEFFILALLGPIGSMTTHAQTASSEITWNTSSIQVEYNKLYGKEDEPTHRADIYRPRLSNGSNNLPAVILIHGGAWTLGDKSNDVMHAKRLAQHGVLVMCINYRLSPKHMFPAQLDDCYLAQSWLCEKADELRVDIDRIGAWGYSAGGHLAALLATKPQANLPRIKACVAGGAPCDLTLMPDTSRLLVGFLGGTRAEYPDRYRDASPVSHVSSDDPPFFLFHGTKDALVPPKSTQAMVQALERANVPFEEFKVQDKAHLMTFLDKDVSDRSFEFLQKQLQAVGVENR